MRYYQLTRATMSKPFQDEIAEHINKDFPSSAVVLNKGIGWYVGITESYWRFCCAQVLKKCKIRKEL